MIEDEKVSRLVCSTGVDDQEATAFVRLWEAMKEVDREEAEERRVEHAREMSRPRDGRGLSHVGDGYVPNKSHKRKVQKFLKQGRNT